MPLIKRIDYSDFRPTDSSPPLGDSEGRIQPEEAAVGYVYTKRILRFVPRPQSDIQLTLTGFWRQTIRESIAADSRILFDQKITFRSFATFDNAGGATFQSLDNDGKFETTIVNGEAVPQDETGHYEGWRYVETSNVSSEVEFATAEPNGFLQGTIDGVYLDFIWSSPAYKMDLPEGAVLRIEDDQWRDGRDIPIAWYKVSIKPGATVFDAVRDPRLGQSWHLFVKSGALYCNTVKSIGGASIDTEDGNTNGSLVLQGSTKYGRLFRSDAALRCLAQAGSTAHLLDTPDDSATWKDVMALDLEINLLASASTEDGAIIYVYGTAAATTEDLVQGAASWAILKSGEGDAWTLSKRGGSTVAGDALPLKAPLKLELLDTSLRLTARDNSLLRVWVSDDEMKTWKSQ